MAIFGLNVRRSSQADVLAILDGRAVSIHKPSALTSKLMARATYMAVKEVWGQSSRRLHGHPSKRLSDIVQVLSQLLSWIRAEKLS
jgi:hypothetical protein